MVARDVDAWAPSGFGEEHVLTTSQLMSSRPRQTLADAVALRPRPAYLPQRDLPACRPAFVILEFLEPQGEMEFCHDSLEA